MELFRAGFEASGVVGDSPLRFGDLSRFFRKGLRSGGWYGLTRVERGLFRASMWFAKVRGRIVNGRLIGMLRSIMLKLASPRTKLLSAGLERARELLSLYERTVFHWAPQVRKWFSDQNFIIYVGLSRPSE